MIAGSLCIPNCCIVTPVTKTIIKKTITILPKSLLPASPLTPYKSASKYSSVCVNKFQRL